MQIKFSHLLYKNAKLFIFLIVLSITGGMLIKYLMPDRYLSFAEVYANGSYSLKETINNPDFGYEVHADRLKQILESQPVKDSVVQKFDLYDYYDIDSSSQGSTYQVYAALGNDLTFSRNSNMAIVIKAKTKDPQLSADIVNYVLDIIDPIFGNIIKYNTQRALSFYREKVKVAENRVDSLLTEIYEIRPKSGDSDPLANRRSQEVQMRRLANSATPGDNRILELSGQSLSKEDQELIDNYVFEYENLKILKQDYLVAKLRMDSPTPGVNIVSRAKPNPKSSTPSVLIYIGILLTFGFLGCIVILFLRQKIREIRSEL